MNKTEKGMFLKMVGMSVVKSHDNLLLKWHKTLKVVKKKEREIKPPSRMKT